MPKKILMGSVVSNKAQNTLVVSVKSAKIHPLYKKRYFSAKKYHVHDPYGGFNIGDTVKIIESRPYSKTKTWCVISEGGAS